MSHFSKVISWNAQLATGLPQVDVEHRRLIDLINKLGVLHQVGATEQALRAAIGDLRRYSVYHFQTEADLMNAHPVEGANRVAHLAAHHGFVDLLDRVETLVASDPDAVIEQLLAFTVKWLVHHITGVDARMAKEILALQSGVSAARGEPDENSGYRSLIDTVSELYDGMAARTFDLLQANQRMRIEMERRQRAEQELQLAAIVYANVDEAVMVTGADNLIITVNPSFSRITGYAPEEVIGRNPRILSGGINPPEFYQEMWGSLASTGKWQGEIRNRRKNGDIYIEWLSINRVKTQSAEKAADPVEPAIENTLDEADRGIQHVGVFSDVTNKRAEAERIQRLAHFDLLTSLPNRALFEDRARQALARAKRDCSELAVMYIDLDWFKEINDTLGHDTGDLLLREAAQRMQSCLRASDTVARMGGDEFVALLPEVDGVVNAMAVAQKICNAMSEVFDLAGHKLRVSCSIGIAIHPGDGNDEKQLLKNADIALYRAKQRGRNCVALFRQEAEDIAAK